MMGGKCFNTCYYALVDDNCSGFTQVMSNIALAAILVPLAVTLAAAQGQPVGIYAIPVAISCSLSFMFPCRSNSCNGIWNRIRQNQGNTKSRTPMVIIGIIVTVAVILTIGKPFLDKIVPKQRKKINFRKQIIWN